jgi:hypothetical protein
MIVSRQRNGVPQIGWRIIFPSGSGQMNFGWNESTSSDGLKKRTSINVNDNTWKHFVCTYDGGTVASGLNIYVNGVVSDEITVDNYNAGGGSFLATAGSPRMVIGSRYDALIYNPEIDLRTLNIYNKELTQLEVKQNYNALKEKIYGT